MNKRKVGKTLKRILSAVMALVLVASVMVTLTVLVSAENCRSLQYVEKIKGEKTPQGVYSIFELVPDTSETTISYYAGNDPIYSFINSDEAKSLTSANRQNYINNIYAKLSDIIGPTEDYPLTSTGGYKEYAPWEERDAAITDEIIANAEEMFTSVPNKFRAPTSEETGTYQTHGVYVMSKELFDFDKWISNDYTKKEITSGLDVNADLEANSIILTNTAALKSEAHTGYALTSVGFNNYYSMEVTPGSKYLFSFDFDFYENGASANGINGQVTFFCYNSYGASVTGERTWECTYTDKQGKVTGPTEGKSSSALSSTTHKLYDYLYRAYGDNDCINSDKPGHYEITFTVPEGVKYVQLSLGTCCSWAEYGSNGSIKFSNIHLKEFPDMVQKITTFEPAVDVKTDTEDDYYYSVNYTPLKSTDEYEDSPVIYEQVWDNKGEQYYYFIDNETGADGTVTQKITLSTISEHGDSDVKIPAYKVHLNAVDNESADEENIEVEYSQAKLDKGGYGRLSINEDASVVVTETPDAEHFYHAVPVYNSAGDLSFAKVSDIVSSADNLGYYSGDNSYFVTKSKYYTYNGYKGDVVYDNSINTTETTTVYTQKFFYDKGFTNNDWFTIKVLNRYKNAKGEFDDKYDFSVVANSYSPQILTDEDVEKIYDYDMIVLSAGTMLNYTSFSKDITSEMRSAIIECAGSAYNKPIVVDLKILDMVSDKPELKKLVETLIDRSTEEGKVNIKNGGVAQNVYAFSSSDVGSASMATSKFNTAISKDKKSDGSYPVGSPYYDVYSEIYDENVYRDIPSYQSAYEGKKLDLLVSEATCMRCIINYAGRRPRSVKKEIRVLDIEPYVSVDHRTEVITNEVNAYASSKYKEIECLKATEVIGWLPDYTFTKDGKAAKASDFSEEEAAEHIKITTMSVAELVGHNENIIGNYDLVYFGDSLENFNNIAGASGQKYTHYNDSDMDGLIYSGMGDKYSVGNNGTTVAGDTILGLNVEDYAESGSTLIGIMGDTFSSLKNLNYIDASTSRYVRTSGNDITDTVEKKLDDFAASGLPVVIASNLTNTVEGAGLDGGVYDEEGNLQVTYSLTLETKTVYRRDNQFYTFFLAKLNGDLPTGLKVEFKWYYASGINGSTATGVKELASNNGFDEPIHVINTKTETGALNWYSTIGDIDQNFSYYDWNEDGKNAVTGMTIPDSSGGEYQAVGKYFYCVATLKAVEGYENDANLSQLHNKSITSNIVQATNENKTIKVTVSGDNDSYYTSGSNPTNKGYSAITFEPNPYYAEGISDNISFYWKFRKFYAPWIGSWKWKEYIDDGAHRIETEQLWQAFQKKVVQGVENGNPTFTEEDITLNFTSKNGILVNSVINGNTITIKGYDYNEDGTSYLAQEYIAKGSRDDPNNSSLTMISYCAHSSSGHDDVVSYVECWIKGVEGELNLVNVQSGAEYPTGFGINLDDSSDPENLGGKHEYSSYSNKRNRDTGFGGGGTYYWSYTIVSLPVKVENSKQTFTIKTTPSSISTITVDNTTKLYKFLSSVYDTVTDGSGYVERGDGATLCRNENVFDDAEFKNAQDVDKVKEQLRNYLLTISAPQLQIVDSSVVSYPAILTGTEISGEFIIYDDADTNSNNNYKAYLYIDQDHDAKFSKTEKFENINVYPKNEGGSFESVSANTVKSSTTDHKQDHVYKFSKQLSSAYMGLVSWKLEVVQIKANSDSDSSISDSYTGYSYIKTSEKKAIKAVQVLPADWWTAGWYSAKNADLVSKKGSWNHITKQTWTDEKGDEHTVGSGEYTGSLPVGYVGKDSELKEAYETERTNEVLGNAYYGSVFLGDDGATKIVEKTEDGQYKVVYADAFYSLINSDDSVLKRTVYNEATGDDKIPYRTHVVFWVRPEGTMTPRKDKNGSYDKDYEGNYIYEYEDCDFEVDIALTDIYELNCKYSTKKSDHELINEDSRFLDNFDMLILGFGDSYGKCGVQTTVFHFGTTNFGPTATLGFNAEAASAIRNFIDSKRPVLFCHDTTNTTNDYLSYFGQKAIGVLAGAANKALGWLYSVKEKIKSWLKGTTAPEDDKTLNIGLQDSKVKDGYYNNILLRDSLNLDRFGITYSIRQTIGEENIIFREIEGESEEDREKRRKEFGEISGENSTWAKGYLSSSGYNGIPYYQRSVTSVDAMKAKNFSIVYKSTSKGNHVNRVLGDNNVYYVEYGENGEPVVETQKAMSDDKGNSRTVDIDKSAQGFTTWTIIRYGAEDVNLIKDDPDNHGNKRCSVTSSGEQHLPAGFVSANEDGHVVTTNKVQQVNKGQITTYPYDINTAEFGGTMGNTDTSSESYGKITIKATHEQVYQVNTNGDDTTVWYTLAGADEELNETGKVQNLYYDDYDSISKDVVNSYYIFTSGNITYTGAGHSNIFSEEEAKLFLNTLVASYKLPGEHPDVDFADNKGEDANYILLTVDGEDGKAVDPSDIKGVASINIIDHNLNSESFSVVFKDKDGNVITDIKLYTTYKDGKLSGETALDKIVSDKRYYFEIPQAAKEALADNTSGDGSYTIKAVATSVVKVSGVNTPYTETDSLTIRRVGLYNLS